jgi:S-adenosylmethionine hydrolase
MGRIVTLLTDFGSADGYVGEVKGILHALVSEVNVVDISHEIERHDTNAARLALARYWRRFPPRTIHIAVVDPGVGSERAALAVQCDGYHLVGPDTGILSPALLLPGARAVRLPVPAGASHTFHGRDVFAPAAASLALGAELDSLGEPHPNPVVLRTPEPHRLPDGSIAGEVIHIDRFGNVITNIIATRSGVVQVRERSIRIAHTYASVAEGEAVALTGSNGLLEIAIREGNAARVLRLERGDTVKFVADG